MRKPTAVLTLLLTGSTAMAWPQVRQGAWTPAVETVKRGYSSISYWTYRDDGVEIGGGRVSIEHGLPVCPVELEDPARFDEATLGKVWRLGNNKWTTLDTQLPLDFEGGSVAPGIYYLGAERDRSGRWLLSFVDPQVARAGLLDAWAFFARPREVPVFLRVPLSHARVEERAEELRMTLSADPADMSRGTLTIRWGPHSLETSLAVRMVPPEFYKTAKEPR